MSISYILKIISRAPILRYFIEGPPLTEQPPRNLKESAKLLETVERRLQNIEGLISTGNIVNIVSLIEVLLADNPRYADPRRLLRYSAQVCSQNGEDGMIGEVFRRIGIRDKTFVEVGVGNGHENNTAFLLSQGWTGYWLDGNDSFLATLEGRPDLKDCSIKGCTSFLTRENVAGHFAELGVPKEFDFMSLDIDQNTYYLWEGLTEYRPRLVVVEFNASVPPDIDWKVRYEPTRTWDGSNNFGASLKAYELLGNRLGYSLVGCDFIGVNAFFVRNDLLDNHFAEPFTALNHYEPPRYHLSHRRCHPRQILDKT